jgi:hypothetical protein
MTNPCEQCKLGYKLYSNSLSSAITSDAASIIKNDVTNGNITISISDNTKQHSQIHTFMLLDPLATGNSVTILPPTGNTINSGASYIQTLPISISTFIENSGDWLLLDEINNNSGGLYPPGSSTDNAVVRWNGTTGNVFQNSVMIVDDLINATGLLSTDITIAGEYQKAGSRIFDIDPINRTLLIGTGTGNPIGSDIIASGKTAAGSITTGQSNILIGQNAANTITKQVNNIAIGSNTVSSIDLTPYLPDEFLPYFASAIIGNSSQMTKWPGAGIGASTIIDSSLVLEGIGSAISIGYGNNCYGDGVVLLGADITNTYANNIIGRSVSTNNAYLNTVIGNSSNYSEDPLVFMVGKNAVGQSTTGSLKNVGCIIGKNASGASNRCAIVGNDASIDEFANFSFAIGKDVVVGSGMTGAICIGSRALTTGVDCTSIGADSTTQTTDQFVIGANTLLPTGCARSFIIGTNSTLAASAKTSIVIGPNHTAIPADTIIIGQTAAPVTNYHWRFVNMPSFATAVAAGVGLNSDDIYNNTTQYSTIVAAVL